jgi:hypothetical protein
MTFWLWSRNAWHLCQPLLSSSSHAPTPVLSVCLHTLIIHHPAGDNISIICFISIPSVFSDLWKLSCFQEDSFVVLGGTVWHVLWIWVWFTIKFWFCGNVWAHNAHRCAAVGRVDSIHFSCLFIADVVSLQSWSSHACGSREQWFVAIQICCHFQGPYVGSYQPAEFAGQNRIFLCSCEG